jgi:hypothetical protein
MRRETLEGRLVAGARLVEAATPAGAPRLELAPGGSVFLAATRRRPRRFLTYDTGSVESLFVDLGADFDPGAPPARIDAWREIGFLIAGMRIVYLARSARGSVAFHRESGRGWFGRRGAHLRVAAQLSFDQPDHDVGGLGAVGIDWRFPVAGGLERL